MNPYSRPSSRNTPQAAKSSNIGLPSYPNLQSKNNPSYQTNNLKGGQDQRNVLQQQPKSSYQPSFTISKPIPKQQDEMPPKLELTTSTSSYVPQTKYTPNLMYQSDDQMNPKSNKQESYIGSQQTQTNISKGICGLRNIGNTCFLNSVLQCLFNLPGFNEPFADGTYSRDLGTKSNSIPHEYSKLVSLIRSTSNFDSVAPYGLKSSVEHVAPNFRGYAQQDAQEFMVALLDGLSLGLNRVKTKPVYKELTDNLNGRTMQDISQEWWNYSKSRENSLPLDFLQGQLLHTIKCNTCHQSSFAFDTFSDISLAIARAQKLLLDMNLHRLVETYLQEEAIDDYYCQKCKKLQRVKRKFTIWRLPPILIFHIKRFDFRRFSSDKLNHKISFPLELDMKEFVNESLDPSTKSSKYELTGIVNHSGNLYGGHYTADGKNPFNGKWYRYNDSDVREININLQRYDSEGSSSPYILFYSKIK